METVRINYFQTQSGKRSYHYTKSAFPLCARTLAQQYCCLLVERIYLIYRIEDEPRTQARIFRVGDSQAARLSKQFLFKSKEVEIFRRGNEIVLREEDGGILRAFDLLASLPDDLTRPDPKNEAQLRKGL